MKKFGKSLIAFIIVCSLVFVGMAYASNDDVVSKKSKKVSSSKSVSPVNVGSSQSKKVGGGVSTNSKKLALGTPVEQSVIQGINLAFGKANTKTFEKNGTTQTIIIVTSDNNYELMSSYAFTQYGSKAGVYIQRFSNGSYIIGLNPTLGKDPGLVNALIVNGIKSADSNASWELISPPKLLPNEALMLSQHFIIVEPEANTAQTDGYFEQVSQTVGSCLTGKTTNKGLE